MLRAVIDRLQNDLERTGEVYVASPEVAECLYSHAKIAGLSSVSLDTAFVLRTARPPSHPEETMRDRAILFLMFAGVLLLLGVLLGHWATTEVEAGMAQFAAQVVP